MDGPNSYKGVSEFARAVSESGFGRVCPKCYQQWSDKLKFMTETKVVGTEVGVWTIKRKVAVGEDEVVEIRCPKRIHQHHCGGQMYIDIQVREGKESYKNKKAKQEGKIVQ